MHDMNMKMVWDQFGSRKSDKTPNVDVYDSIAGFIGGGEGGQDFRTPPPPPPPQPP